MTESTEATEIVEPIDAEGAPETDIEPSAEAAAGYLRESGSADEVAPAPGSAAAASAPRTYDFQRPVGMADTTRRLLELGFEQAAAALETWLGAHLREPLEVTVEVIEEARFGLFRRELVRPCNAFLMGIEGTRDLAVLEIDAELAFTLLERGFGSQAEQVYVPERALTWIERVVLRELVEQTAQIIGRAWREQLPLSLRVTGFESVPEMLPQDNQGATLQARLRVGGEGWLSGMTLALPGAAVSTAIARRREETPDLDATQQAENRGRIQSLLQDAEVPISVRLPRFPVSLRQISDLKLGAVVTTAMRAEIEVEIYVGDSHRFRGRVGRQGDHLAVEILGSTPPGVARPDAR